MISDLLKKYIYSPRLASTGFHQLKCPVCSDYKDRLGIKFDYPLIIANCFNCGFSLVQDETKPLSKKFKSFAKDLGASEHELEQEQGLTFFANKEESNVITLEQLKQINLHTPEIELPPSCTRVTENNFPLLNNYLKNRQITLNDYSFYGSSDKKYEHRLIIPFYKGGKLIYWQARTVINDKMRYLNPSVSKEAVIFNSDLLYRGTEKLFVCEGVFDAILVNGISIIGSKLNEAKIQLLQQSRRELIFVIDGDKNGFNLGEKVLQLKLGKVTTLAKGHDVNSHVQTYGRLFTYYKLIKNIAKNNLQENLILRGII